MSDILKNKIIENLMKKAPDNVKQMLEEILGDDKLSISEKIAKLQASIEDNKNYEKAKKISGFFGGKLFGIKGK